MPKQNRVSSSKQSSNASRIGIPELCRQNDPSSSRARQSVPSIQSLLSQPGSSYQTGSSRRTVLSVTRMWTFSEDRRLRQLVNAWPGKWDPTAIDLPGRTGQECRERWENNREPKIPKRPWTKEEDAIVISEMKANAHERCKIAEKIPGRTPAAVNARFYSALRHKSVD